MALKIANLTQKSPEKIMAYLHFMGQLYDFDFQADNVSDLLVFQNILDTLKISVDDLTREITIPCDELLRTCFWRNVEIDCSSLFLLRLTYDGYCCAFNYVKFTKDLLYNNKINPEPLTTDSGIGNGLYVSIRNDLQDYYYTTISSIGVMINIFVPSDYPDKSSGSLTEILTHPNSENFIEIVPTILNSVRDVTRYSIEKRKCIFAHERLTGFGTTYSQSDCNMNCRITSMLALCQCIPFIIPLSNKTNVCTLADIPCLNRYKEKWTSLYPNDLETKNHLEKEKQDSLRCDTKCHPPCEDIVYGAQANSFPILNKTSEQNITHVYIYYLSRFSHQYFQDVVYYWFEVLSNFGGIFGIFVGWSLIFVIQLFAYYIRIIKNKIVKI